MSTILTGIKPTGSPHVGNYLGAIRPAIELAKNAQDQYLYFIADLHSLTSIKDSKLMKQYVKEVAATWLACGLDPYKVIFYKQSDIPEISELSWILSCFTPKGDLNRAHAYKALVQNNLDFGREDVDQGVSAGVYFYPILMAADIMLFDSNFVPVGQDQRQHIEMARSIGQRMNQFFKSEILILPHEKINEATATIIGLDGRKMSKSYNNTIPLFVEENKLRKLIMKMATDSKGPNEPKETENSAIFSLYQSFSRSLDEVEKFKLDFSNGISWGEAKEKLFLLMNNELTPLREKYFSYYENDQHLDEILNVGQVKARTIATKRLKEIKSFLL